MRARCAMRRTVLASTAIEIPEIQKPSPAYSRASFIATTGSPPAVAFAAADQVFRPPVSGPIGRPATRGQGPQPARQTLEKNLPSPALQLWHAMAPMRHRRAEIPARYR